jgi:hypothetical protein
MADDTQGTATGTPEEIMLGSGIHALTFESWDATLGQMREVWFIHAGTLYEVTTFAPLTSWLDAILQTWKFI